VPRIEKPQLISEFPASQTWADKIDFVIGFLRRRFLTILIFFVSALLLGGAYLLVSPAGYTATATMMIDPRNSQILQPSPGAGVQLDSSWIDSQIGILKSANVVAYVVKQLRLADDPGFIGSDGLIDKLLNRLSGSSGPKSEEERAGAAMAAVYGGLDVRRVGQSYMIAINFRSYNPEQAVKIANAMIDGYIYDQLSAKFQINRSASGWLQERLEALRGQAAAAERAVIEFKAKNNIVAVSGTLMNEKQLSELSGQLATARSRAGDLKAKLDRIEAVRRGYQNGQPAASAVDESVSDELSNPIITKLRGQYLDLVNREADWSVRYGKDHNAVVTLRNQIRDIRKSILDELGRIGETYKSDYEIAKIRQDEAEKAVTGLISDSQETNQAQVTLFTLQAAAQSYRKIYDSFLQQYTQSVQQQSFPITEARAVSSAGAIKTSPKPLQVWLVAMFAGGMLGVGFATFREIMDRGFRTREQVRSVLDTECLAMVPRLTAPAMPIPPGWQSIVIQPTRKAGSAIVNALGVAPKSINHPRQNNLWAAFNAPSSLYAEALRSVRLSIDLKDQGTSNVIGLTSCFPGEGKSTIAAGVAALMAEGGANVILVDCDVRNPSLSRAIAPHARAGLLDVIAGAATLAQAVRSDATTNLHFLPAVRRDEVAHLPNALEALASDAAKSVLVALKAKYDYVIVDLAPLIAGTDNRAAARLIDSYVLVIEWGSTKVDAVEYALRHAPGVHERMVGAVLNKVDLATIGRYDNYGAHYYYARSGRPDLVN
jgi:succinoglycan biosynthesis transport protein ExoP